MPLRLRFPLFMDAVATVATSSIGGFES